MKSGIWISLTTAVLVTIFWDTHFLFPFKILVVLIHEIWHGLSSMSFGATIDKIMIHPGETGETLVRGLHGGWAVAVSVSAGYIGTAVTGALILRRGLAESFERTVLAVFAGVLFYMTVLFTSGGSLAFWTGIGWASVLSLSVALGEKSARAGLLIVGTMLVWYSFYDMLDFTRDLKQTDAGIFAKYTKSKLNSQFDASTLSVFISIAWSIIMVGTVMRILAPIVILKAAPAPAPAPDLANAVGPQVAAAIIPAAGPVAPPSKQQATQQQETNADLTDLVALRNEVSAMKKEDMNLQGLGTP